MKLIDDITIIQAIIIKTKYIKNLLVYLTSSNKLDVNFINELALYTIKHNDEIHPKLINI